MPRVTATVPAATARPANGRLTGCGGEDCVRAAGAASALVYAFVYAFEREVAFASRRVSMSASALPARSAIVAGS